MIILAEFILWSRLSKKQNRISLKMRSIHLLYLSRDLTKPEIYLLYINFTQTCKGPLTEQILVKPTMSEK